MKEVLEGSQAVAEAVRLAKVKVVSAYPITPQTHIVEELAAYCADGRMDARFICVESEHSAMASVIGAQSGGVRSFTASSSHGLALMHEMLHWASAARLPIVMAEVNRALGPGWNLWVDQTDSLAQRDTGWLQFYCADGQEAFDTTLMAYKLAERVNLPVMIVLDAFFLSHTYEPVEIASAAEVDAFLPPYVPKFSLDPANPYALSEVAPPAVYMEMRRSMQLAMEAACGAQEEIAREFESAFGRRYGPLEAYRLDDAEVALVVAGTAAGTARVAIDRLRSRGIRAGLARIRMFRPFPAADFRATLRQVPKVAVLDRNCSFGAGGIFAQELKAGLYGYPMPQIFSYIAGLGGRDITVEMIESLFEKTLAAKTAPGESDWLGLNEEMLKS